ncbi:SGNH/GDSL hydrolase family protein [Thermaerobacillus caldiproteolyticus]|uniref:SGNH/GDSL hydrolase family protein n=1 Tax=Thermaerobacillus caldiproteolyticus TaxID=247480 RepID=UPI00188B9F94|nr:SGNH/GDSL hydrolase family protein [Anoxybacillus caldiproteolyticus]QPA32473.1 SGNH/GDSL hydrolase family protein [Anoxybacillus caldiproteolyticus]
MKKWGLCIWFILFCAGCSSTEAMNIADSPLRQVHLYPLTIDRYFFPRDVNVLAIGDSLTEGVGDNDYQGGYVSRLQKKMLQHKGIRAVTVTNLGKRGLRLSQLDDVVETHPQAVKEADIIFITIGGNDVMKIVRSHLFDLSYSLFEREQKTFVKRLDRLMATIRTWNEDATIVLIGLYNPFSSSLQAIPEIDDVIDLWNNGSKEVISRYDHTIFVDVKDLFDNRDDVLYSDQFHPNELGYELIATRVYEKLQKEKTWLGRIEQ